MKNLCLPPFVFHLAMWPLPKTVGMPAKARGRTGGDHNRRFTVVSRRRQRRGYPTLSHIIPHETHRGVRNFWNGCSENSDKAND